MELSLKKEELLKYIQKQLSNLFPDHILCEGDEVKRSFDLGLQRLEYCFSHIKNPAYSNEEGQTFFSHLHSDQMSQFLYYFANSLWKEEGNTKICDKLILMNRTMSGMFYSYKGQLPSIMLFSHPVGTVLGNAAYSDYLFVSQNVTVNSSRDKNNETAPKLGKGLFLSAGCSIIGSNPIGDRVSIGVDRCVFNEEIPDDYIARKDESGKNLLYKRESKECKAQKFFRGVL